MIDHFGINCADWDKSKEFYDKVLGVLGFTRQMDFQVAIGYGRDGKPDFWIADMNAGDAAGPNREIHVAFQAADHDAVQAFYDAALALGRRVAARAAAVAGVPPRLFRRLRPRPRRQQRRSRLPRRCAGGLVAERLGVVVPQRFPPVPAASWPTTAAGPRRRGVVEHVEA